MKEPLVVVVGSVTRAYALSVLAGSRVPQTAYRVAKLADLSPPNVYLELRRLESAGIVRRLPNGWLLVNERVRTFFEGTGPLSRRGFSPELRAKLARGDTRQLGAGSRGRPGLTKGGGDPRVLREFSRSTTKNASLRAAGLRPSRHRAR